MARSRRQAGQSVVEFALVLPVLLGLFGAALDYSRFNAVRTNVESAARSAAEYVATNSTSSAQAAIDARRVACAEFGMVANCTDPAVSLVSYSTSSSAPGATAGHPLVTAVVQVTRPFQTLFPYPLLTSGGTISLQSSGTYAILQAR
ncbi:MAG: TadE family protein [Candidatus Limnocylindrales bacterium]